MKAQKKINILISTGLILICLLFSQILKSQDNSDFTGSFNLYTNNFYSSNEEVKITISAYSIKKNAEFEFSIYKIRDIEGFFSRQTSTYTIDVLSKDSINMLYMCDEIETFHKTLKTEGYDNYYYSYQTIDYRPKSKGAFLVRAKYKNQVAYTGFFVTDIGMITEAANNGMLAYTIDKKTGEPINNADLTFLLGKRKIGTGKTFGGLFFKTLEESDKEYAASENVSYPLVIGKYDDNVVVSDPYLYFGYGSNRFTVYIYTNQPVYRPKSTVEFKGTVRKTNGNQFNNYPDKDVTVTIKDSKGAEIYKQVLKTNDNGSFNGNIVLDDNAAIGVYYIYAMLDENQTYTGQFSVEEYKKPEYKVNITVDKDQYTNADKITGVVNADYYFGSPVQDAKVTYNIYKKTFYKPWWYFSEYKWWYEDYYESQDENAKYNNADFIFSGEGKLDKDGRFDFSYIINEDFKAKNNYYWYYWDKDKTYETDYIYIIQAKVTDKSRREINNTKTVYVTRASFYINARTAKYIYKPDESVEIEVKANNFSDKPVETSFEAKINKITWGRYPDYKQEKSYVTTVYGKTNFDGTGFASFEAKDEGYYEIEVTAIDNNGKKVTENTYCYVSNGDLWWWWNQSGTLQIIPDKESYKAGEICKALIVTTNPGASVLITTQNDNILTYRVEKIDGTSKMVEIPVDADGSPNFYINACYVNNGAFYTASKNVMVIPDNKFLSVMVGTDKTQYKPKEEGTFTIRVTDEKGNTVPNAEISVGVVDESIYAIKADNTKDIRKFFFSPKFNSVYAHYNNSYYYYGYSRQMTIYERFNVKSLSEYELGTIKGRLTDKNGNGIVGAVIIIDNDYIACTTGENGDYEFKLPEGSYEISVKKGKKTSEGNKEISVKKSQTITINLKADSGDIIISDLPTTENQQGVDFEVDESGIVNAPKSEQKSMDRVVTKEETAKKYKKGDDKDGKDLDGSLEYVEPELRSDFKDAMYWSPYVKTDENGMATVNIKFPDNLTTWRVTSRVITSDTKVGQEVNTVLVRKDLLVRIETPRFFQQRDEVTITTIVHNYLNEDKDTKISLKLENLTPQAGTELEKNIKIAKNEEKQIDWKISVTEPVGFAKLTATALTNQESDAVEVKVPLQPHGLKLSKYLAVDLTDPNITEIKEINVPEAADLRSTKLTLNVAPSLASTILTALDELVGYPYGCVEQTMSRFLPTVIVANAFHDLNAPLSDATKKDLPKMVEAGYNKLYGMQHYDGGWGWWTNDQSHPFMTAYVIYGLALGDMAGFPVKKALLTKGINNLKEQLKNTTIDATTRAYMLYALSVANKSEVKSFQEQAELLNKEKLNDYAISLLSMTASNIGDVETSNKYMDILMKNVQGEGGSVAYWGGQAWHYNWQDDKVQTTAMAVKAMVNNPKSLKDNQEVLNKAIRWLMMQRHGYGWNSTQETAFIVFALVDYLKNSKELEPDYNVKIYINNEVILDKKMTKDDVFKKDEKIVFDSKKLKNGINDIKVEKNGVGKIYISSELNYYTTDEEIKPTESGFRVEKEYFKLEKYEHYGEDKITYRKKYFDGTVKPGDEVLVKIKVSSIEDYLQYFILEDPIPAGCEIVKDDWAYKVDDEKDYTGWDYYWWRWWYADKDIRDNRVSFFATYLYGKQYEFSYILKAQIPGRYNVIPATGMLMYYPEIRGTSEELRLWIEE